MALKQHVFYISYVASNAVDHHPSTCCCSSPFRRVLEHSVARHQSNRLLSLRVLRLREYKFVLQSAGYVGRDFMTRQKKKKVVKNYDLRLQFVNNNSNYYNNNAYSKTNVYFSHDVTIMTLPY